MRRFVDIAIGIGIILLAGAALFQDAEWVIEGLVALAAGIIWDFAHDRKLSGREAVDRWRPSQRTLRIIGILLAVFAAVTTWGVYAGNIPSEIVVIMLVFVVIAPVLAAPYLYFYRRAAVRSKAAESWSQTTGRVENSFMQEVTEWPAPIVIYTYSVGDRAYRRSRVLFGGTGMMNPTAAEQVLASFPTGAEVPVFFDPKRPGQSVLLRVAAGADKRLLWAAGISAGAALAAAAFMALIIVLGLVDTALTAIVGHRVLP